MTTRATRLPAAFAETTKSLERVVRKNKYNAQKVELDGITFDSKKEARRYGELKLLAKAGEIGDLKCHPKFPFVIDGRKVLIRSAGYPNGRQASFKPDFSYWRGDEIVVEDVKSRATRTEAYALRKAILEAMYPRIKVVEV